MLRFLPVALGLATLSASSTGCFYDSTWGARKTAQQHNAAVATPASLGPPAADPSETAPAKADGATTLRVRVHGAPAYATQTPDWKAHIGALLAQAGVTLQASLGVGLVLETADAWDHPTAPRLEGDLAALREEDTGEGVDLVIGLVGGLPLTTQDFDQLGMSEMHGKHLVVRAPNVAGEYEAVERAFDELSAEDRTRLRRERIRHREVAVLLHEIGHALGAEHQTVAGSLMRRAYDPKMAGFDAASVVEMRRGLAHAAGPDAGAGAPRGSEVAKPQAPPSASPPVASPPVKDDTPSELAASDRALWRRASDLAKAGDAGGAWTAARPLFARYPASYGVQDLRCKLAMAHFTSYAEARPECDALMRVTIDGSGEGGRANGASGANAK